MRKIVDYTIFKALQVFALVTALLLLYYRIKQGEVIYTIIDLWIIIYFYYQLKNRELEIEFHGELY